nr:hypothetical protein [uncultured Desulfobulbus sp.]
MKVHMGIFQEQEQIDNYLESKGIEHDDIMVAGPFSSRLQAVEWMDFMEKRIGQGRIERHAVGLMNQQPWYGLTFEPKASASLRSRIVSEAPQMAAAMQ